MTAPPAHAHWQSSSRRLLEPLAALMRPGRTDLPIEGPASEHDTRAGRLDGARPRAHLAAGHGQLAHPRLGSWEIRHRSLPARS